MYRLDELKDASRKPDTLPLAGVSRLDWYGDAITFETFQNDGTNYTQVGFVDLKRGEWKREARDGKSVFYRRGGELRMMNRSMNDWYLRRREGAPFVRLERPSETNVPYGRGEELRISPDGKHVALTEAYGDPEVLTVRLLP